MKLDKHKIADVAEKGAEMRIDNPATGEPYETLFDAETGKCLGSDYSKPLDGYIRLIGTDSAEYQRRIRAWVEKNKGKSANQITLADSEKNAMETRIACVVGWCGIELDGKNLEFSPENARLILTDPNYRWLCEQIDAFMGDRANFIKRSGKS